MRIGSAGGVNHADDYGSDTEGGIAEDRHSPRIRQTNLMAHTEPSDPLTNHYTSLPRNHHNQRTAAQPQPGSNTNSLQRPRRTPHVRGGHGRSSSSTSDNNSDATYTDSELALTHRQNGKFVFYSYFFTPNN